MKGVRAKAMDIKPNDQEQTMSQTSLYRVPRLGASIYKQIFFVTVHIRAQSPTGVHAKEEKIKRPNTKTGGTRKNRRVCKGG